jgi:hypothetical protein
MYKPLLYIITLAGFCYSLTDTTGNAFFIRLEMQLRADYAACTGDTALLPVKTLVTWKHLIDSMADLPEYPAIAKEYKGKTGNSPVKDGPCKVLRWKLRLDSLTSCQPAIQQKNPSDPPAVRKINPNSASQQHK